MSPVRPRSPAPNNPSAANFTHNSGLQLVCKQPGARYPSGKGEVCKTFMRRFDPDPRLHHFNNLEAMSQRLKRVTAGTFVWVHAVTLFCASLEHRRLRLKARICWADFH